MTNINIIGTIIGKIKVISFAGRTKKAEPLYNMTCQHCGVQFRECHHKILNALEGYQGQVQCPNGSCRLGLVEKKVVVKESGDFTGMDSLKKPEHSSGALAIPKVVIKEPTEFERLTKARRHFDNENITFKQYDFIKTYRKPIYNKLLAEIEAYETGGLY
jgi:hypothetical protein